MIIIPIVVFVYVCIAIWVGYIWGNLNWFDEWFKKWWEEAKKIYDKD